MPRQILRAEAVACADLRWYCKDAKACTDRWTSREGGGKVRQRPS